jgi:hypothetical protein
MKMPKPFCKAISPRRAPRIEFDTPLVPRAVMVAVCHEAGVWLGQPLPRRWIRELTERANTIYAHNRRFRRKIRGKGTSGRDYLWMFARHWLAALMGERRPHLYARLPSSYSNGHPLPAQPSAPPAPLQAARKTPTPTQVRPRPRHAPEYAFAAAAHFHFP